MRVSIAICWANLFFPKQKEGCSLGLLENSFWWILSEYVSRLNHICLAIDKKNMVLQSNFTCYYYCAQDKLYCINLQMNVNELGLRLVTYFLLHFEVWTQCTVSGDTLIWLKLRHTHNLFIYTYLKHRISLLSSRKG